MSSSFFKIEILGTSETHVEIRPVGRNRVPAVYLVAVRTRVPATPTDHLEFSRAS